MLAYRFALRRGTVTRLHATLQLHGSGTGWVCYSTYGDATAAKPIVAGSVAIGAGDWSAPDAAGRRTLDWTPHRGFPPRASHLSPQPCEPRGAGWRRALGATFCWGYAQHDTDASPQVGAAVLIGDNEADLSNLRFTGNVVMDSRFALVGDWVSGGGRALVGALQTANNTWAGLSEPAVVLFEGTVNADGTTHLGASPTFATLADWQASVRVPARELGSVVDDAAPRPSVGDATRFGAQQIHTAITNNAAGVNALGVVGAVNVGAKRMNQGNSGGAVLPGGGVKGKVH